MTANTLQELQDIQGFVIVAYHLPEKLAEDDRNGRVDTAEVYGWLCGLDPGPAIIGPATREEWLGQCRMVGQIDPPRIIAYRKVRAE